jgi:hypothetical protein
MKKNLISALFFKEYGLKAYKILSTFLIFVVITVWCVELAYLYKTGNLLTTIFDSSENIITLPGEIPIFSEETTISSSLPGEMPTTPTAPKNYFLFVFNIWIKDKISGVAKHSNSFFFTLFLFFSFGKYLKTK